MASGEKEVHLTIHHALNGHCHSIYKQTREKARLQFAEAS